MILLLFKICDVRIGNSIFDILKCLLTSRNRKQQSSKQYKVYKIILTIKPIENLIFA